MKKNFIPLLSSLLFSLLISGCGGGTPATADAAVLKVVNSLKEDDPAAIWEALPESYQKDVNDAVREFAAKVDPEVWKACAETFGKLEEVLREKKGLILELPVGKALAKEPKDTKNYDQIVAMIGTLKKSDLMSHGKMKKFDGGDFLEDTMATLMKQMTKMDASAIALPGAGELLSYKAELATFGAKLVKSEGDTATVEITGKSGRPMQLPFVRVEGKWINKHLAEDWKSDMEALKKNLSEIGTMDAEQKARIITMTTMAKGVLDQMLKARTTEEFEGAMRVMDALDIRPPRPRVRGESQRLACLNNLRQINASTQQYMLENNTTTVPPLSEIKNFFRTQSIPTCPAGGVYSQATSEDQLPTCSLGESHNHRLSP